MINALKAEFQKYRRTFAIKLIVLSPLVVVGFATIQKLIAGPNSDLGTMQYFLDLIFNWWTLLFIPLGVALLTILVNNQEKKAGHYRSLNSHAFPPARIWMSKILVLSILLLISSIILILSTGIMGILLSDSPIPWKQIISGAIVTWFVSSSLITLQLWVATLGGVVLSIGLSFFGFILSLFATETSIWWAVPWSWSLRLMGPIIGVRTNGLPLESADPLMDPSVIFVGMLVSCIVFISCTALSALWFNKREVR